MERIDAPDFPDVRILQGAGLYRLEFVQFEQFSTAGAVLSLVGGILVLSGAVLLSVPLGFWTAGMGWPWIVPVALLFVLAGWLWKRIGRPPLVKRAIEIDRGGDELRIYRGAKIMQRRPLSALDNLAIEDHPLSQNERNADAQRFGPYQKQHCLVGYFGRGGGEKVLLLSRFEFPNERSLLQVRAALLSVLQRPAEAVTVRQGPALE